MAPRQGMFSNNAIERRLGIADPRGPQGIMSRGANVYNSGSMAAQQGPGGPGMGRPPMGGATGAQPSMAPLGQNNPAPTMTTMAGSLPPNSGNADPMINDAIMALLKNRMSQNSGVPSA